MSQGINKVMVIGNLGRDPELRYTQSGTAVASLNVATTRKWRDKKTDQMAEETEWHRVTVFGQQAEHCNNYLSRGRLVYVEGRLRTRAFVDKNLSERCGQEVKRYNTEIVADTVQFLGSSGRGAPEGQGHPNEYNGDGQGGWGGGFAGDEGRGDEGQHDPANQRTPEGKRRGS